MQDLQVPEQGGSHDYGAVWFEYEFSLILHAVRLSRATRYETGYQAADELKAVLGVEKIDAAAQYMAERRSFRLCAWRYCENFRCVCEEHLSGRKHSIISNNEKQ